MVLRYNSWDGDYTWYEVLVKHCQVWNQLIVFPGTKVNFPSRKIAYRKVPLFYLKQVKTIRLKVDNFIEGLKVLQIYNDLDFGIVQN